jgi:outer membrane immunogenic protein
MRKVLLATTALSLIPFASSAADLPVKAPVLRAPVAVYNWTGFYAGGNVGYSWGRSDVTVQSGDTFIGTAAERLKPTGAIAGLQAGYNWQTTRNWVFGLETDFQWSGQKDSITRSGSLDFSEIDEAGRFSGSATGTLHSKLSWFGTARARVGYVPDANPGLLLYVTGGLAYGRVKTSFEGSANGSYFGQTCSNTEGGCDFTAGMAFSAAKTKVGGTVGAGIEGDLGNLWSWKVEYLYVDLGKVSGTVPVVATVCQTSCESITGSATYSNKMTDNIVRVGINRRFGP